MNANTNTAMAALMGAVNNLLTRRRDGGPTYQPDQLRLSSKQFGPAVVFLCQFMTANTEWRGRFTPEQADSLLQDLTLASELYMACVHRFQDADGALATSRKGGTTYSLASHQAAEEVGNLLLTVRTALGDAVDGTDEQGRLIREGCGVGEVFRYESPVEMQRFGTQQVLVLSDASNTAYLIEHGVRADILGVLLGQRMGKLDAALDRGGDRSIQALRDERNDEQIRAEILTERILSLVGTAMGVKKRDELRDRAPVKRRYEKKVDDAAAVKVPATTQPGALPAAPPGELTVPAAAVTVPDPGLSAAAPVPPTAALVAVPSTAVTRVESVPVVSPAVPAAPTAASPLTPAATNLPLMPFLGAHGTGPFLASGNGAPPNGAGSNGVSNGASNGLGHG